MTFLGLTVSEKNILKYEVVSDRARLKFTRLIRGISTCDDIEVEILRQNKFINIGRNVLGMPIYVLKADDWGQYDQVEHAWHNGEVELVMRRPDTDQLIETLADLIENNLLHHTDVNEILSEEGTAVTFQRVGQSKNVRIHIVPIDEIAPDENPLEHPNIRFLVHRMDRAMADNDFAATLHASASIFETLGKDIVSSPSVQNQTLGSFFEKYRKVSGLPDGILDYMLEIYRRRNTEPLAGHGNTQTPTITQQEAIVLAEMTKSFVRIERQLAMPQLKIDKQTK